ncbi:OLC1v1017435C1 [Oldenlandia corymbosa var. corymbosa]|uniref:OLC1v1017435C1 n=1 Tax=Oldenlandia corymbosa var. corymbosa TaxID=529605 RepID=A0AAV1E9J3_OLDCO|nr:OLC1v1017435C1 [Oldenlandia corymbosa var. corymbosa]
MREVAELEGEQRCWSDLSHDLLGMLLYYLPPESRRAFKATCKSWNTAQISVPPPIDSTISAYYYSCPILMFANCYNSRYKFYNPINHEFFHVSAIGLKGAIVRCSKFGWLLMSLPNLDVLFYNPITKQKIELPRSNLAFTAMCFTSPPTSPDCQVFAIAKTRNEVNIIRHGEQSWQLHYFGILKRKFYFSTHNPVFHNGSFYCLDESGDVGVFHPEVDDDDESKKFTIHYTSFKKTGWRQLRKGKIRQSFLLENDGKLFGIFNRIDNGINIMWLDTESWKWLAVHDLPNKSLFVSHSESFAIKGIGNRVYFPKFHDKVGVYYSLDRLKYYSVAGNFSSTSSYELDEVIEFGVWIRPNFDLVHESQLHW